MVAVVGSTSAAEDWTDARCISDVHVYKQTISYKIREAIQTKTREVRRQKRGDCGDTTFPKGHVVNDSMLPRRRMVSPIGS